MGGFHGLTSFLGIESHQVPFPSWTKMAYQIAIFFLIEEYVPLRPSPPPARVQIPSVFAGLADQVFFLFVTLQHGALLPPSTAAHAEAVQGDPQGPS